MHRSEQALQTTARVLARLRRRVGEPVSGAAIAKELGISRAAVCKHVAVLLRQGCVIEAATRRGYRLLFGPEAFTETVIASRLVSHCFWHRPRLLQSIDSTNRALAEQAAAGVAEGAVIVAEQQTAGRGRLGRTWHSPPGFNLYFSVLLRPAVEMALLPTLPLMTGCALARAVRKLAPGLPVEVKWPNDLLVRGRKLAGVLCEMTAEANGAASVAVGIGLNVNLQVRHLPQELKKVATSLAIEASRTFDRADVLTELLAQLESAYRRWLRDGLADCMADLSAFDALQGQTVRIVHSHSEIVGTAAGIDSDGTLRVRLPDGRVVHVHSGDAHVRQPEISCRRKPGLPGARQPLT